MARAERRKRQGDRDKEGIRTAKRKEEAAKERGMDMVTDIEVWQGRGGGCEFNVRWQKVAMVGSCCPHVTSTFHACPGNVLSS